MRLDDYLKEAKLSQEAFSLKFQPRVTQGLVSQWIRGKTRISLDQAIHIRTITNGAVSVDDCAAMFDSADRPNEVAA